MDHNDQADAEDRDYCTDKFLDAMEELREENAALRAEVERLRGELRWRSTKTEPPSDEQWQVLIYDGRNVDIGDKLDGIGWTHEFGTLEWEAVTHWMPLPAPPDAG